MSEQIQHSPSPGIEQTEASTDKAVSVFTHASAVVTRALTTAAGPETHHQHQDVGGFPQRQHASVGRGSGGSGQAPHRRGARTSRQRHEVRAVRAARTGRETGARVPSKALRYP